MKWRKWSCGECTSNQEGVWNRASVTFRSCRSSRHNFLSFAPCQVLSTSSSNRFARVELELYQCDRKGEELRNRNRASSGMLFFIRLDNREIGEHFRAREPERDFENVLGR